MNTFPSRSESTPTRLSRLAELVGSPPPSSNIEVIGVAPLAHAEPKQIGLLADRGYAESVHESRAGAILTSTDLAEVLASDPRPRLVVDDPRRALAVILEVLHPVEAHDPEIHPTAIIGHGARIGSRARIGPYAVIEAGVRIGDAVQIGAHVVVGSKSDIGDETVLHPHVVVYPSARIGRRVIAHAGARIGADGFGYAAGDAGPMKVPQVGTCVIEDDVEIGANTTVDRGSIGETRLERHVKLDNLVQVGHNVRIGQGSMLAAGVGIGGSTDLGRGVMAAGHSGVSGHVTVGDGARLGAQAGVIGDVPPGATVLGFPARPRMEFLRSKAAVARLPDLVKRVAALERESQKRDGA